MTLMCGEKWLETGNPFVEGDKKRAITSGKDLWNGVQ